VHIIPEYKPTMADTNRKPWVQRIIGNAQDRMITAKVRDCVISRGPAANFDQTHLDDNLFSEM
jgi:hypothetical protein